LRTPPVERYSAHSTIIGAASSIARFLQRRGRGILTSMGAPPAYERRGQVDRQRVARLIARLALGIAVGAALAFVALEYL
jgi:hypothetical protein